VLCFITNHGNKIFLTRGNTQCSSGCDAADGGGPGWQGIIAPCLVTRLLPWWQIPLVLDRRQPHRATSLSPARNQRQSISCRLCLVTGRGEAESWLCQKAELPGGGTRLSGSLAKCLGELVMWHCLAVARTPSATSRPRAQPERGAALQSSAAN